MVCNDQQVPLILMQTVLTISLCGVLIIDIYIIISRRIQIYAYQLISWIIISQTIVYISIYPFQWGQELSSQLCTLQAFTLSASELITVLASTNMAVGVYRGVNNQKVISNRQMALVVLLIVFGTQSFPLILGEYQLLNLTLCGQDILIYCSLNIGTISFYIYVITILISSLVALYFCIMICKMKINNVQINRKIYVFPLITFGYFVLYLVQVLIQGEENFYIVSVLNLSPGIAYSLTFVGILLWEHKYRKEEKVSQDDQIINTSNEEGKQTDQNSEIGLSESVLEYKKQVEGSVSSQIQESFTFTDLK